MMTNDIYPSTNSGLKIVGVIAVSQNGVIGIENRLPWHLRSDLQRFKKITMGHTLFMGRKTYESIGRPLPGRRTIVLSRSSLATPIDVTVVTSLPNAIQGLQLPATLFVVGGAQVYRHCLPRIDEFYVTRVLADVAGDSYFDLAALTIQFRCESQERFPADENNDWPTSFEHWVRIPHRTHVS
jgi:dihydrofolate reductase